MKDPDRLSPRLSRAIAACPWLAGVLAHARRSYPDECCGILAPAPGGEEPGLRAWPCRNLQDELHARDPERHPRSARTAYRLHPADYMRVEAELARGGGSMVAVYHSHTDAGAYFSDLDRAQAAPGGEPLLPGVDYLVVSVFAGHIRDIVLYRWDRDLGEYVDAELTTLGQAQPMPA